MKLKIFSTLLFLFSFSAHAKRILFLGDSLTAGYGVARENSYPSLIEMQLKKSGKTVSLINASISGSTTASAVKRLKWQLKQKPDILVLALGANDGLRGFDVKISEKNLSETIELAKSHQVHVILAGMRVPPNYGKKYAKQFDSIFAKIAKSYKIPLIPFLLEGVAGQKQLNQADGIHPNEKGHQIIAKLVYPFILEAL